MTLLRTNITQPHLNRGSRVSVRELAGRRLLIFKKDKSYIFHFKARSRTKDHIQYSSVDGSFISFRGSTPEPSEDFSDEEMC
jgi:hypothetical protein